LNLAQGRVTSSYIDPNMFHVHRIRGHHRAFPKGTSMSLTHPPHRRRRLARRGVTALAATTAMVGALALSPVLSAPAAASVFTTNDYCLGQCNDVLPPGENGNATLTDILLYQSLGIRPGHSSDQLGKYANLVYGYPGLTDAQLASFYNDGSFGVAKGQVDRTEQPRSDVTIVRDSATGVPHVNGSTRAGTMFGAGYAGAEDRLYLMDLLRHVGRGQLTSFAGGAPGNRALEQSVWRNSPYTEADLQAQVDALRQQGTRGAQLYDDVQSYIAGINKYISDCNANSNCPGEYSLTNAGSPKPFVSTDIVAVAGVVGGLFGGGGGGEMQSALVRIASRAKYGATLGDQVWAAFREQNDPETVLTLHNGQSFPYGTAAPDSASVAMPDPGTAAPVPVVYNPTGSAGTTAAATTGSGATTAASPRGVLPGLQISSQHQGMSNAVVVSGANTTDGHPIAVFGPQTGYFAPQLLMLEELQGPGVSARGVAFAGLNLYVLIGRGQDYAWSATSAEQDITDTFAVPLCDPTGAPPTTASDHYLYHGQCLAMDVLARDNSWSPSTADPTPSGSYRLVTWRTKYGLVSWRGLVNGAPVAFTSLRSTYRHEADSAIGFQMYDDPAEMGSSTGFQNAASHVGYAFNWFYVNSTDAAYFNSGNNPVRASGADPNLPMSTAYEWQGWNPDTNTATYTTAAQHPSSVNQDYYVSWNNKQAKDYSAADGNFSFGPVQRAQLLDAPVRAAVQAGTKLDRAGVVRIAEDAATVDLRGRAVLADLLRVINSQPVTDPTLASVVSALQSWQQAGAKRKETAAGSHAYQYADAIRILDAWWPLLVSAEFRPGLGDPLYQSLASAMQINESPSGGQTGDTGGGASTSQSQAHKGSSFQFGWWGYVSKDIRAVLGDPVASPLPQRYCGGGDLASCRQTLLTSLAQANATAATSVYPGDDVCAAGNQWCADSIEQSPLGGITHPLIAWQNRPTYQQVVSFPAHRGDDVSNLALNRPVSASSTQLFYSVAAAVDGDPTTRWSSGWSDNQWIRVDLGTSRTVSRVVLRWEAAYARSYRIEVSADGVSWRSVWSTTAGDGGVDDDAFAPTTARYVRMYGVTRATSYGFSLYELEVYAH
jgi:acyl-homoserine lactone acylase PvdQ